ncbi:MAG: WYL domain-containing protein [Verrucomicrobiales bacterium]|nr:WYL domain-containing protein [Verrucomicrobiales bacterium]
MRRTAKAPRKAKALALPSSRPPLERMMQIHQAIQSGDYPTATTLANQLEVSIKSIHRDLEFMRDRLQLPLAYDEIRHGWHYTEDVASFPTLQITEGELFALLVAEKALQQYRGTHFERPLVSAFKKMAASLPDTISLNLAEWEQTISFRTSAEPLLNLQVFDTLAKATTHHQQLKIHYRKPGGKPPEERLIDPYHLANINGEWYLFAYDHLRKDLRTFVPSRIQSLESTGKKFERPARFSLENRLRNSFSVHSGDGEYLVVVRFTAQVADFIREKKWHPSQFLKELPHGGVELRLTLSSLNEVERWILAWGGDATVVEPAELKARIRQAAERLQQSH